MRDLLAVACGVLVCVAVPIGWVREGRVFYSGDAFFLPDPWNAIVKQLFVWNQYSSLTGELRSGLLLAPWYLMLSAFSWLTGSSHAQMLVVGCAFALGWAGIYAALRLLRFGMLPSILGATCYAFNPWTQTLLPTNITIQWCFGAGAATTALLVAAARYPARRRWICAALMVVAAFPAAIVANNLGELMVEGLYAVFGCALALFAVEDRRAFARWLLGTALFAVAAALWWLLPAAFEFVFQPPAGTIVGAQDWSWVVARAGFDNLLRFLAFWAWPLVSSFGYASAYDANPLFYAAGFAPIAFGALSVVVRDRSRARLARAALATALVLIFLSKGLHAPLAWVNALFYKLPLTEAWREPTTKLPLVALAALAVCTAIVCERAMALVRAFWWRAALGALVALAFVVSAEGLFGQQAIGEESMTIASPFAAIPSYWFDAARWLNAQPGDDSMLVVPAVSFYQVDYYWGLHAVDAFVNDLFHRPTTILGNYGYGYTSPAEEQQLFSIIAKLMDDRSGDLAAMLRLLGVRYVLYRGDVAQDVTAPRMTLADLRAHLPGAKVERFGPLAVLDLGPALPELSTGNAWIAGNYGTLPVGRRIQLASLLEPLPRIDVTQLRRVPSAPPVRYEIDASQIDGIFPGGDLSRRAIAGVPVRYLWSYPVESIAPAVRTDSRIVAVVLHD
ncbi:MAG TPA: alpha-(1-_3)-arabinofuranosyltransferase family protein, partial [Verrucomicrobiae bacterium]|nr:alpha-(1->3)-arabinofuranosyltransferase family protein [Verrucomicrobiae bacterium]